MFCNRLKKDQLYIDGRCYNIEYYRQVKQSVEAPRLVVVAYQPNKQARDIVRVCIQAIQQYTPESHELWIVDNNSPEEHKNWLLNQSEINVIFNYTEPTPPNRSVSRYLPWKRTKSQQEYGSYANAIGLELAVRLIEPETQYLMPLHMDTMPCRIGWLSYLLSKLENGTAAAGVRMDKTRTPEGVLHVLGYLVNYQIFRQLELNFMPQLPQCDVGDLVTLNLRKAGYEVFACHNTLWEPHLIETIPASSPFKSVYIDRAFDDENNIIFLHLGRGIVKSVGQYHIEGKTMPEKWVTFAERYVLE